MVHEEVAPEPTDGGPEGRHSSEGDARARAGRFAYLGVLVCGVLWGAIASYVAPLEIIPALVLILAIVLSLVVAGVLAAAAAVARARKHPDLGHWLGWAAPLLVAATVLGIVGGPAVGYRAPLGVELQSTSTAAPAMIQASGPTRSLGR